MTIKTFQDIPITEDMILRQAVDQVAHQALCLVRLRRGMVSRTFLTKQAQATGHAQELAETKAWKQAMALARIA